MWNYEQRETKIRNNESTSRCFYAVWMFEQVFALHELTTTTSKVHILATQAHEIDLSRSLADFSALIAIPLEFAIG